MGYDYSLKISVIKTIYILIINLIFISNVISETLDKCVAAQSCFYNKNSNIKTKCSPYGTCTFDSNIYLITKNYEQALTCECIHGYTNLNESDPIKCCYKQKSQYKAFLLECIGLGFGHYYIGNYGYFWHKLILFSIALFVIIFVAFSNYCECGFLNSRNLNKFMKFVLNIVILSAIGFIVFIQMLDLLLFGMNKYKDENNMPLAKW